MKREIRAGAIAGMAGVGAVVDVGQESFLIPGTNRWQQSQLRVIDLPRLSARLHKVLKAPIERKPKLDVRRFPRAMFCEKCRKMVHWRAEMERLDEEPRCQQSGCAGTLVPMRFVRACENGHLDDVDWSYWAHSGPTGKPGCKARDKLSFRVDANSATGSLASVRVECACGSYRTLEDLSNKNIIKETFRKCTGRHPWIFGSHEECGADVVVLQRGATNLHYPVSISALDIPAEVREDEAAQFAEQIRSHSKYQRVITFLKSAAGDKGELLEAFVELISTAVGCKSSTVLEVVTADAEGRRIASGGSGGGPGVIDQALLLDEEWGTIRNAIESGGLSSPGFVAEPEELAQAAPQWIRALVSGVLLVRRLREVRAYQGFQRVKPGAAGNIVPPDVGGSQNWLPATEVYGEGLVLALDFDMLRRWADRLPAEEKSAHAALESKRLDENFWFLPKVDPVFIAIHTIAHLLLRRITFECGYSSSSLRERLYFNVEKGYAGLMIYTADGDSEGSLGGLVRQGRKDRLAQSVLEAMDQGQWCSADPVCSETAGQGLGGFNHAACHACSLVSETSCVSANTLLDRRMLFSPQWGLLDFLEQT